MNSIDKLFVKFHGKTVGELTLTPDGKRCVFRYDKEWLVTGFSISPLDLPLKSDLFIAPERPFWGNFGIFEDSLPDGYGRYLLNRMLRRQGIDEAQLTPLQRLSIVGVTGMGALCYEPETKMDKASEKLSFDRLQQLALEVLAEKNEKDAALLYYNSGNSGGCRPKCLYHDEEGDWLVKFRHIYDPKDLGLREYQYNEIARRCGIEVPDFKLFEGMYFATRRFDIADGERLHVATAGALLNESIDFPKLDYKTLLHLTGYLTQDPKQVETMFRLMAFNVFVDNKDDHAKNFSFICRDGRWCLAPAYDLTPVPEGYHGEHATSVNDNGRPTVEDMLVVGESIRIPRRRGQAIIDFVWENCKEIRSKDYQ
jgi:serine/threonine-protein kinase HipA